MQDVTYKLNYYISFFFKNFFYFYLFKIKLNLWQIFQRTYSINMVIVLFIKGAQLAEIKSNSLNLICFTNI